MTDNDWTAVDRYITDLLLPADPALDAALDASTAAGLPAIAVSPALGKLLHVLAKAVGAKRILEIGTLGGYSTIWLARALPADGQLVTLEIDPKHAEVARRNFERAGVADRIDLKLGPALDVLPTLRSQAPFDFVFIDADKGGYTAYLPWAITLSRIGALIIADNVVRAGKITDSASTDENVQGIRRFNEALAASAASSRRRFRPSVSKATTGSPSWSSRPREGFVRLLRPQRIERFHACGTARRPQSSGDRDRRHERRRNENRHRVIRLEAEQQRPQRRTRQPRDWQTDRQADHRDHNDLTQHEPEQLSRMPNSFVLLATEYDVTPCRPTHASKSANSPNTVRSRVKTRSLPIV
jgi:predicted O-methyltransferase YrrM